MDAAAHSNGWCAALLSGRLRSRARGCTRVESQRGLAGIDPYIASVHNSYASSLLQVVARPDWTYGAPLAILFVHVDGPGMRFFRPSGTSAEYAASSGGSAACKTNLGSAML